MHGESYWHRNHQLAGIGICSTHVRILENSTVNVRAGRKSLLFINARKAMESKISELSVIAGRDHLVMVNLANDAKWLLENYNPGTHSLVLYWRYLRLLIGKGLATYSGKHPTQLNLAFSPSGRGTKPLSSRMPLAYRANNRQ